LVQLGKNQEDRPTFEGYWIVALDRQRDSLEKYIISRECLETSGNVPYSLLKNKMPEKPDHWYPKPMFEQLWRWQRLILGGISFAVQATPPVATYFSVAWSVVCLSVGHICAHSLNCSTDLKPRNR